MTDPPARLRQALAARYSIERELGEGGMATVYLAEDLKHERRVALKVLKPELAAAVGAERFLAEIKTTANLQHPNILPLFDSGEADGFLYYVMPHVAGESLRERLDREHQLPIDDAISIATGVAEALDYAHRHDVVHRDIKPGNILLQDGKPVVADFGIALALSAGGVDRVTQTGTSLGTPQYMSPEQAAGDPSVGPASDIYSLGCVLYEMLVGDPPYIGSTPQAILGKVISGTLATPTSQRGTVPANVDAAVRKALERVAADRFSASGDFVQALRDTEFRHGVTRGGSDVAARRWRTAAIVASAVAAIATLALASGQGTDARTPSDSLGRQFFVPVSPDGSARLGSVGGTLWGRPAERSIAISPDGNTLAYDGWWENAEGELESTIFLRRLDQLAPTPLDLGDQPRFPFFSPDGAWLGFYDDGAIRRRSMVSGEVQTILAESSVRGEYGWSDRGEIVFIRGDRLMRVSESGGAPREVEIRGSAGAPAPLKGSPRHPSPVPGTSLVTITDARFGNEYFGYISGDVWIVDLETGEADLLVEDAMDATLTPAGLLFFMREGSLFVVRYDAAARRTIGSPVMALDDVMHSIDLPLSEDSRGHGQFVLSPPGHLAYVQGGAYPESRRAAVRLSPAGEVDTLNLELADWQRPRVSPSGDKVALLRGSAGRQGSQVVIYDPERRTSQALETGGARVTSYTWGATDEEIVFNAWPDSRLYRQSVVGGSPTPILPDSADVSSALAADALTRGGGIMSMFGGDLWTVSADGEARRLLDLDDGISYPALSPDERWIAYRYREEVHVRPFDAAQSSASVTVSVGGGSSPAWSHDGSRLYFYYPRGDVSLFYSVQVTPDRFGSPSLMDLNPQYSGSGPLRNFDVDPDGYRYFVTRAGHNRDNRSVERIYVLDDFVADVAARLGQSDGAR